MHPLRSRFATLATILAAATSQAQTLDWVARFNDTAAGNDDAVAAAASPTGEMCVLARYNYGYSFFKVSAAGAITHESHFAEVSASSPQPVYGPVIDAQGGAYLARARVADGINPDFTLLRLAPQAGQWTESYYADPTDRAFTAGG